MYKGYLIRMTQVRVYSRRQTVCMSVSSVRQQRRPGPPVCPVSWVLARLGSAGIDFILAVRGQWPSPVRECVHWPRPASDRGQRPSAQELSLRSCCSAPSSALQVSCDQGPSPDTPLTVLTVLRLLVTSLTSDTSDMPLGAQWHPGHVGPGLVTPTIIQMTTWYKLSVGPKVKLIKLPNKARVRRSNNLRVRVRWFLWGLVGAHLHL